MRSDLLGTCWGTSLDIAPDQSAKSYGADVVEGLSLRRPSDIWLWRSSDESDYSPSEHGARGEFFCHCLSFFLLGGSEAKGSVVESWRGASGSIAGITAVSFAPSFASSVIFGLHD